MAALRLILRFREFNKALDTIAEHNGVLYKNKFALWGWWRKDHEPEQLDALKELQRNVPFVARLINTDAKRCFEFEVSDVIIGSATAFEASIPAYYRNESAAIPAWFKFEEAIRPIRYDGEMASQIGNATMLPILLEDQESPLAGSSIPTIVKEPEEPISPLIVHVSDIHFGPNDHAFLMDDETPRFNGPSVNMVSAIIEDVKKASLLPPGLLVISGDITSKAAWSPMFTDRIVKQMTNLADGLGLKCEQVILAPGNHDFDRAKLGADEIPADDISVARAIRYSHEENFRTFRQEFLGHDRKAPLSSYLSFPCDGFELQVGVLNSAALAPTKFVEYGYVGAPLDDVLHAMDSSRGPAIKILVLHHHLVPITQVESPKDSGVSLTLDAAQILERAQMSGVQLILHGHQHIPKVLKIAQMYVKAGQATGLCGEDLYIVASGSAGSRHTKGRNTYTLFEVDNNGVSVTCRQIDPRGQMQDPLFQVVLPISPK